MSKQKSRKIVLKRFKLTKKDKLIRKTCNTSHLNRKDDVSTRLRKSRNKYIIGKFKSKIVKMMG